MGDFDQQLDAAARIIAQSSYLIALVGAGLSKESGIPPFPGGGARGGGGVPVLGGEPIPRDALESCYQEAQRADAVLLVGTSAVVYPAAEFPAIAYRRGARLIEGNPPGAPA